MKSAAFKLSAALAAAFALAAQVRADGAADRAFWVDSLVRIANPVVTNLAAGTLHASMPRRAGTWTDDVAELEAFGRVMTGLGPWLGLPPSDAFWTEEESDWTQRAAWSGRPARIDHRK